MPERAYWFSDYGVFEWLVLAGIMLMLFGMLWLIYKIEKGRY